MSSTVPLSVNLMPNQPVEAVVELAVLAEQLGCTRCWVYDEGLATRDVYVTLTAIALATDSIKIGTGITNPYVRHPAATASAIATLNELSGGRAFVGVGAGGALTLGPLMIDRHKPVTAVAEMVEAMRRLFDGETVDTDGDTLRLRNASLPNPAGGIEIILAGRGPRMIDLAMTAADGFYLSYLHHDLVPSTIAKLRSGAVRRPFTITYSTAVAMTDAERDAVLPQLTFRLVDSPPEVKDLIGFTAEHEHAIRAALSSGGPAEAAAHIDPAWVEHFAIVGSADECRTTLHNLLASGVDDFQLAIGDLNAGAELIERTARLLAN